ncbi:MAG: GRP family sugar transporter [Candidatus Hodarchaeota archaeon]
MAELIGYLLAMDALFTWALASLVYKWGLQKTQAKPNLFFRLCCVSLSTFIISIIFGSYLFLQNMPYIEVLMFIFICFISGLSVTIGDLLYYMSLKKIDASRAYPLTQLSLVFVYPFSFFLFGDEITISILIGGALILSSVFILSSKDKPTRINARGSLKEKISEDLIIGVLLAIGTAFFWAVAYITFAYVTFNPANILIGDVFVSNFFRVGFGFVMVTILGVFKKEYYDGFRKENRKNLKYFILIGIAGILSLGLADAIFIKAAEINGLVLTATITANTPMVQQIFSILILKEKFRKRFLLAVILIILGNYIILFL